MQNSTAVKSCCMQLQKLGLGLRLKAHWGKGKDLPSQNKGNKKGEDRSWIMGMDTRLFGVMKTNANNQGWTDKYIWGKVTNNYFYPTLFEYKPHYSLVACYFLFLCVKLINSKLSRGEICVENIISPCDENGESQGNIFLFFTLFVDIKSAEVCTSVPNSKFNMTFG